MKKLVRESQPSLALPTHSLNLRGGLFPSHWPSDHGDTQRTQCSTRGGLPAVFDEKSLTLQESSKLYYPVFMYVRRGEELYVYGRGTLVGAPSYFAKVDPLTLEVQQFFPLPFSIYVGGGLVHKNGDVYLVHGQCLYRFKGGDLGRPMARVMPSVNGVMTCYNGVTVASDGHLLLKGWSLDSRDAAVFTEPAKMVGGLLGTLGAATLMGGALGIPFSQLPLALGVGTLAAAQMMLRSQGFEWRRYLSRAETGSLLSLDPESLETVDQVSPKERLGFARITVTPAPPEVDFPTGPQGGDLVLIPGETALHAWNCRGGRFSSAKGFEDVYRSPEDGSYSGCGPTVLGEDVFFTDNVAPIHLTAPRYRLFKKSLISRGPMEQVEISEGAPGFNFWSNAVSPSRNLVFSWDTLGGWVEARSTQTLERVWRGESRCSDCLVIGEEQGHVYTAHYDAPLSLQDYQTAFGPRPRVSGIPKSLRVFNLDSGERIADVPLGKTAPCMSMILPGLNDDVFVGTRKGLIRVSASS